MIKEEVTVAVVCGRRVTSISQTARDTTGSTEPRQHGNSQRQG